jgi:C_GCAxxG_C_C family probable redox protein
MVKETVKMDDKLKETKDTIGVQAKKDKVTGINDRDGRHFNCAESTVLIINDKHPLQGFGSDAMKIMSTTGGSVSLTGTACGAVIGIATALGLAYGVDGTEPQDEYAKKKMENFMLSRGIINEFKEKFGSVNCIDLTGLDFAVDEDLGKWGDVYAEREKLAVNCHTYIDWAAERVLKTLNS